MKHGNIDGRMEETDMVKRTVFGVLCVVALLVGSIAEAQTNATFTLRSGEKISGQLVDLGGVGFTVRVNGQERRISKGDVAVVDFTGGSMTDADWAKFTGTSQVVLRSGETFEGQLIDVSGTSPKKLNVRTGNGNRELTSNDVARIVMAKPSNAVATGGASTPSTGGNGITVASTQPWTPTGVTVTKGQQLTFNASGQVQLSADRNDVALATGAKSGRFAPRSALPQTLAGALIGRIGNGQPFGIGDNATFAAPASGQLFLGVNDDSFGDNQGTFQVTVTKGATR
jgi:hypothetical protein